MVSRSTLGVFLPSTLSFTYFFIFLIFILFYFWPHRTACGILVPRPGIEPVPPAVEARCLNHWTAREVPNIIISFDQIQPQILLVARGKLEGGDYSVASK